MTHLPPRQRKAQGDAAEARFRAWLDRCILPHIYVEQSPMTLPHGLSQSHAGRIKRPDFLIGIPPIGTLAFDVKAKTIYGNHILIDAAEHAALLQFERLFSIAVWFICFPPGDPHGCHLFMNRALAGIAPVKRGGEACIAVPLKDTHLADERRDFMGALVSATRLR